MTVPVQHSCSIHEWRRLKDRCSASCLCKRDTHIRFARHSFIAFTRFKLAIYYQHGAYKAALPMPGVALIGLPIGFFPVEAAIFED